jgi:photosystem II stability/assembly factor-like uncharacterized protein
MMSDMKFDAFEADVVASAVRQPPLQTLARRARRRVRARLALASGAVAGVIAIAVVISAVALGGGWAGGLAADPATTAVPGSGPTPVVHTVIFNQQTFVTVRQNNCAVSFRLTTDSGRTWTSSRGPTPWRACDSTKIPMTAFDVPRSDLYTATIDRSRYLSRDAGATWQRWEPKVVPVDAFPVGANPRECDNGCGADNFQVVDPVSGDLQQLRELPPLSTPRMMRTAPDGALWVVGSNADKGQGSIQILLVRSTDHGRTWHSTNPIPGDVGTPVLVPSSGQEAYLLAARNRRQFIYRTTDGGATWTEHEAGALASIALNGQTPQAVVGVGGTLLVSGPNPIVHTGGIVTWVSRDHGQSFADPQPAPAGRLETATVSGLLWTLGPDGTVHLTADGHTWQDIAPAAQ